MKHVLFAALLFTLARPALACINVYGTDLQGKIIAGGSYLIGDDLVHYLTDHPGSLKWRLEKAKRARTIDTADHRQRNDYAAVLLHLGQVDEALRILLSIEQTNPGLYATATNLGTAYELAGDNARALQWIREGIRRNPGSHEGTEWLHVSILLAKQELAKDPAYFTTHSVLNMDFGDAAIPQRPAQGPLDNFHKALELEKAGQAIATQMHERLQFVKPPDAVAGDLLFDYGNLLMLTGTMESASVVYDLAVKYGAPRSTLAKQRKAHAQSVITQARKRPRRGP